MLLFSILKLVEIETVQGTVCKTSKPMHLRIKLQLKIWSHKETISHCWYHLKSNFILRRSIEIPLTRTLQSNLDLHMLSNMLFAWLLNGGCTGVINRTHMGNKWHWAAYIEEQPVVPWDRSHWCVSGMESLSSSFLVSEHSCILGQSGQNFTAYFWQHVKELVVKPLASGWSAQFSFSLYSVPSMSWGLHCTYSNCTSAALFQVELQMFTDKTSFPQFSAWIH